MAKREMKSKEVKEEKVLENEVISGVDTEPIPEVKKGVVFGCSNLNVRKKPNLKSDPITTIPVKSEVTIDEDNSNKDWYSVTTKDGVVGYCMRKYIAIDQ